MAVRLVFVANAPVEATRTATFPVATSKIIPGSVQPVHVAT